MSLHKTMPSKISYYQILIIYGCFFEREAFVLSDQILQSIAELKQMLEKKDLLNHEVRRLGDDRYHFFVSDEAEKFRGFANSIIKYGILSAKIINIEEY